MVLFTQVFYCRLALLLALFYGFGAKAQDSGLHLADPALFVHNGLYYLYGTVEGRTGEGFQVYTSTNKQQWQLSRQTPDGFALKKGEAFGSSGFWAPQVFAHNNRFYMAYVANEQIAIATADHPAGPFRQTLLQPLPAPVKQIDPFVFIDDDGKKYLYHVRLDSGNKIFAGELLDDFSGIKPGTATHCISAEAPWENTANAPWPVAEGPSVIKHRGVYYLFYTANDFRNPDYAVGYATANHPLGPWKKHAGNPILNRHMIGQNGPGHGDFIRDGRNRWCYVFHTHFSPSQTAPRRTAIIPVVFKKGKRKGAGFFEMQPEQFRFLQRDGEDR